MCKLLPLNDLTRICGYFNHETEVNNHYGCNHPDCSDLEMISTEDGSRIDQDNLIEQIVKNYKISINGATQRLYDEKKLQKKYNIRFQGCCYSHSCPLAIEADYQALLKHDPEWAEQYSESNQPIEIMLITGELLEKKSQ